MAAKAEDAPQSYDLSSIFWTKAAYHDVAADFHKFHKHDLNVFLHLWTTGLGLWGAVQLAMILEQPIAVYVYIAVTGVTCPLVISVLHTAMLYGMMHTPLPAVMDNLDPMYVCGLAIALGYGLQDVAHWMCDEKTFMNDYIATKPWMLLIHTLWLMPLVIESVLMRYCFLPNLVNRNKNVFCQAASRKAVEDLREWVNKNIANVKVTTHVWPHKQEGTSGPVTQLENDAAIMAAFRKVFAAKHFDIKPVQEMNEIYVTAVGAKSDINSDAVFYTKHNDGPYWFLPSASLYRVLVGVTPNKMVRTRFNLQHESEDKVVDMYDVLGFDYNRELHWIDHVPGATNTERRTLIKLHFIVYPKGWHKYGQLCANLNTNYNTWARNNFLQTLRIDGWYDFALAWWIWLTTIFNATFVEKVGWTNLIYILGCYAMGPTPFLVLTSFRHYCIYITTFAFRNPPVAHGEFMRDVLLFKTVAISHLSRRLLPMVDLPNDAPGLLLVLAGFATTMLATARLGMARTYFGSELGFVKPQWITGFPYGYIPHPMIVGQLFAYSTVLLWWWDRITTENALLVAGHIGFYTTHMVQEMLTSSY
ncbi:Inherit from NOG: Phospholipid methyltransferase [Seminavis robusta]|uniref:phosphatidyl-N-methylethanolamine N-methyltransferase n=1 Tax=Seminavis robusta TaxID=568900 RepID=A0A9N8DCK8_9STRA|nr:Inherit from NOG: Phospholipid methyltransferase [Seminavis robusta]|eukprot:Sro58_g033590.1 Inherit from NOG: Phospholipid methyltransferase (588) ;mRNA; f:18730-20493